MKKTLFATLLFLVGSLSTKANHVTGAALYWDCLGNGDYQFTLVVVSDCTLLGSGVFNSDIQGPFGTISTTQDSSAFVQSSDCSGNCFEKKQVYRSGPVRLSGTPPANGWEFYWTECCRTKPENFTAASSIYVSAVMYPYTPPGASGALPADSCFSSSPHFEHQRAMVHCEGPLRYDPQVYDPDADSLRFRFVLPKNGLSGNQTYTPGYSVNAPFPDSTENPLNAPVQLDSTSGVIDLEFYDAVPGNYLATIMGREYRHGQKISQLRYDLPLSVLDSVTCAPAAGNDPPNISLATANTLPLQQSGTSYRTTLMDGDTLEIQISTSDLNFNPNGTPQTICLEAFSNQMNLSNYALDTGCASPSCATLVPLPSGSSYCGTFAKNYSFKWVPDCRMITTQPISPLSYRFTFRVSDGACPVPMLSSATLLVDLYPGPLFAPNLSLQSSDTSGNVTLAWTKVQIANGSPFSGYVIYSRPLGGTFSTLDSITDIDSLQASYSNLPYPSEFFMVAYAGTCRYGSPHSAVVSSETSIGLAEWQGAGRLRLSPVPAEDHLRLQWLGEERPQAMKASLYSAAGELVRSYRLDPQEREWELRLQEDAGLYLLLLETDRGSDWRRVMVR